VGVILLWVGVVPRESLNPVGAALLAGLPASGLGPPARRRVAAESLPSPAGPPLLPPRARLLPVAGGLLPPSAALCRWVAGRPDEASLATDMVAAATLGSADGPLRYLQRSTAALLLQLLLCLPCSVIAWLGDVTYILPAAVESPGKVARTVSLDCSSSGLPIHVVSATYGTPCQATYSGCSADKCASVKPNNYLSVMLEQCQGKEKCDVSTCPCPKADTCAPQATGCSPNSVGPAGDPARECPKGATVVYRCGAASWGLPFLLFSVLTCAIYLGAGVGYAKLIQKRRPARAGEGTFGTVHPTTNHTD
jgi:hypothetical protein